MIKRWHNLSIQTIIATTYSLAIVLMLMIIGVVSFQVTTRTVDENTGEYVQQLVNQINYDIEYYLKNIENSLNTIKVNDEIYAFFEKDQVNRVYKGQVSSALNDYMVSRVDTVNVYLIRRDGVLVVNEGGYLLKEDIQPLTLVPRGMQTAGDLAMHISSAHIQNMIVDRYKWVVTCGVDILDKDTNAYLGSAMIDLNFNLIDDMLSNISLGEKGYMFIVDESGNIIYHPKHELIYSGIKEEAVETIIEAQNGAVTAYEEGRIKKYIISSSAYSGWKVVGAVYEDELNPYEEVTKQIYTLMMGLALVIAILISVIISRRLLHPIKDLADGMHKFRDGELSTEVHLKETNEFGELAASFNEMTQQIRGLIETNKQAEKAKRRFELKSLQSQINPHFLYNTLDSIVWMAEAGMNKEVVEMTDSLAKLFRISINRGSEFVSVAGEIEHIESYLKIQKLRYGDKLTYEIHVDPDLLACRIVKIIIQPIVENAIYHGIKMLAGPGEIHIHVRAYGEDLQIEVRDNGVGMDEEKVANLLNPNHNASTSKGGIGVMNVDQRIKLYYGNNYGVTIFSEVFEGTRVLLTLPRVYVKGDS